MGQKKFNNIPNEHLQLRYWKNNGENINVDYFISRAIAVVGIVFVIPLIGDIHILITKRSSKMYDEAGKFNMPCGYLDWNETIYEAMVREVYEETSLYLPDYEDLLVLDNKQPIYIKDDPTKDKRQNVSFLYLSVLDFSKTINRFPIEIENYTDRETAMVKLMPVSEFYKLSDSMEWAFNHNETIKSAIQYYLNKTKENGR